MRNTNKKGFTIVELVIVVAVIAILAAVLIPTFSGIIAKANLSADQQAVRQMNETLAIAEVDNTIAVIADAKANLAKNNIDAENYKPLSKGHEFFWVEGLNRIILVNAENVVVYPENLATDAAGKTWWSLSGEGNTAVVDSMNTALNTGSVVLSGTTDMKGASINLVPTAANTTIGGASASAPATIENVVSDEGSKVNATGEYKDHVYYAGLVSVVEKDTVVTVENLVIDGAIIGDTINPSSARAGIIAGQVNGTLYIKNVTIKNSTVFGSFRIGALVGAVSKTGKVIIENVTIENTTVKGGTLTAALIGQVTPDSSIEITNLVKTNITVVASDFNNAVTDSSKITTDNNGDKWVDIGGTDYPYLTTEDYWLGTGDWSSYYANSGSHNVAE